MARPKVGLDLSPIAFRSRAPGTAVHVENQARALLAMNVEWDWVLVATPRVLSDTPFFQSFHPVIVRDAPSTYHGCCRLGPLWARSGCVLGLTTFFSPLIGPPVVTNYFDANALHEVRDERHLREHAKSVVVRSLIRFSLRRSRALFILSNYGRQQMIAAYPKTRSKWVVAPCGLQPVGMSTAQVPLWAKKLNKRPFILYVGAFSENKNQRRLIEAWGRLRERNAMCPPLVLIGPTPIAYLREVIEPLWARTPHREQIIITGFVPTEEVAWAYHAAHAYIQPSFAEGFGMPIVEAMSCGIPVACSDSTSLPEVAGNAAILFDPSNVESIAHAMETVAFDEKIRVQLKTAGLERSRIFTWERHAAIVAARIREELKKLGT